MDPKLLFGALMPPELKCVQSEFQKGKNPLPPKYAKYPRQSDAVEGTPPPPSWVTGGPLSLVCIIFLFPATNQLWRRPSDQLISPPDSYD